MRYEIQIGILLAGLLSACERGAVRGGAGDAAHGEAAVTATTQTPPATTQTPPATTQTPPVVPSVNPVIPVSNPSPSQKLAPGEWLDTRTQQAWSSAGTFTASAPPTGVECKSPAEVASAEQIKAAIGRGFPVDKCLWVLNGFLFAMQPTSELITCGEPPPYEAFNCPRGMNPSACSYQMANAQAAYGQMASRFTTAGQLYCVRAVGGSN